MFYESFFPISKNTNVIKSISFKDLTIVCYYLLDCYYYYTHIYIHIFTLTFSIVR